MPPSDQHYTYNTLSNEDKELLMRYGYRPGELQPEEERDLLGDLRAQIANDEDGDRLSGDIPADERDGTE
ncbi:MAG TPA: hypothetical protein VLG92_03155 [Candidatus Saccharimonadia bacterium]|nr:hypothetical protein [Candidatus Saccharimonadia bacterium]